MQPASTHAVTRATPAPTRRTVLTAAATLAAPSLAAPSLAPPSLAPPSLAAPSLARFAHAAEFAWRAGHSAPPTFALHQRLLEAANTIAERSEGRISLEVRGNSEFGSPVGLMAQARAGTIDVVPLTSQMLGTNLTAALLPMVGFAFNGYDQLWPAIDGGTGHFLRGQFNDRLGLVAMKRCWDFGFRQISTTSKTIDSAADMAGLKLRTPPDENFINLFHALKALPIAMSLSAMLPAFKDRTIDGQESILPLLAAAGLGTVQSNCALTNHVWDGQWICVSGRSWSKLPDSLKDVVAAAFDESGTRQRQDTLDNNATVRQKLTAEGITFNPVDAATFRTMLRESGYYSAWKARLGDDAWTALEPYTGRLI